MTLQKIEFEYDIPDGYKFLSIGKPKKFDLYLNLHGKVIEAQWDYCDYFIIVEKIPEQESKKHRWHDLMIEFANDKTLEIEFFDTDYKKWCDCGENPTFFEDLEYRKKQTRKTVRFRNYLNKANKVKAWDKDHTPDLFVKWISDWQEVTTDD